MSLLLVLTLIICWPLNIVQVFTSRWVFVNVDGFANWRLILRLVAIFVPALSLITVWFKRTPQ